MELVSPDDLRTAAELFSELSLPVQLRVFPSGVAVVQDLTWSDDAVCSTILDVLNRSPGGDAHVLGRGISCMQYAVEASVPIAVATEQLLLAERNGILCRDDSPSGLYFHRNWFMEMQIE
jgi:ESCRT-II complex subunit VPS36